MRKWYSFKALAADSAEISIFDEIGGWGITAKDFIGDLKKCTAQNITVSINSPGGSVFDALAIYNALAGCGKKITVRVMGVAASAASLIAMAGSKIVMPENTFMMIHNPIGAVYGNSEDMTDMAATLDKIGAALVSTYVARCGKTPEEVKALLDAETWMSAEDAVANGFADEIEPAMKIAAKINPARVPAAILAKMKIKASCGDEECDAFGSAVALSADGNVLVVSEEGGEVYTYDWIVVDGVGASWVQRPCVLTDPDPCEIDPAEPDGAPDPCCRTPLAQQIQEFAAKAGMPEYADHWAIAADSLDAVQASILQAREIKALCVIAKKPDAAGAYILAGKSISDVRADLLNVRAARSEQSAIDTSPAPANKTQQASAQPTAITTASIWASRQKSLNK